MSLELYELCAGIFLAQALALPILALVSGIAWWRQAAALEPLERRAGSIAKRRGKAGIEDMLARLPKLAPLECPGCGATTRITNDGAVCTHCATKSALPADYVALAALRPLVARLVARANRQARLANALAHPATRFVLYALVFAEPALFVLTLAGSNHYSDTPLDRAFEALGESLGAAIMLLAMLGFVIWMVVFLMLGALGGSIRRGVPLLPALRPVTGARDTAKCAPCGGPTEYDAGALAAVCDYCHTVSYRARFVGRERAASEARADEAGAALFGAMQILDEYTSTFFFTVTILLTGSALLCVAIALSPGP